MDGKKLAKRDPMSSIKHLQSSNYEIVAVKSMLATMGLINN
jgi:glutamyl/glutaminyl-tRNA synthetase